MFLLELAGAAIGAIRLVLFPNTEGQILTYLMINFRWQLGEYLYYNPFCGKLDFCKYSVLETRQEEVV